MALIMTETSGVFPSRAQRTRIDIVSIFPAFLDVLDLSLIGRAREDGLIDLRIHDLRDWAHDRHRTVDDTPLGGGAGMVMRPDVWGEALDAVLAGGPEAPGAGRAVLLIPTPAGEVFTQRTAEDLARADRLVVACGRYEGIDSRVPRHYAARGFEVRELSIGDYVLNGGEAAAIVMIEAIARLLPGVVGNPASVLEESHSAAGLLEHEALTRPVAWRGLDAPEVLLSGDHARIARARRDEALARTAARRPDMIRALDPATLDSQDRTTLARHGWVVPAGAPRPVPMRLRPAEPDDAEALAALAARTFPDACPPFLPPEKIATHISRALCPERFAQWIADERAGVTVAELPEGSPADSDAEPIAPGELVGYAVSLLEARDADGALPEGLDARPPGIAAPDAASGRAVAELSKVYADSRLRASGLAPVLISHALAGAGCAGATEIWLGTHEGNRRAQKAYKRAGFRPRGKRVYEVGGIACRDVVMSLTLDPAGEPNPRKEPHA
ncbi:hypothetical protein GCM10011612_09080 [Actinomyces gaoshouyii]|uniref:tRNA (guanine-N(1)-)-methyltransferase n=2 Tax=Actinomyces gaoshouyii TaxID=1960083 RepID=A0A8H9H8N5_9ACTO|nr:hypothetical protein GCM10011612_09080 [Actinomyces gaoshouyii]